MWDHCRNAQEKLIAAKTFSVRLFQGGANPDKERWVTGVLSPIRGIKGVKKRAQPADQASEAVPPFASIVLAEHPPAGSRVSIYAPSAIGNKLKIRLCRAIEIMFPANRMRKEQASVEA